MIATKTKSLLPGARKSDHFFSHFLVSFLVSFLTLLV